MMKEILAILIRKKKPYKFTWQEKVGSSLNRIVQVSSSVVSTAGQSDEWACSGQRREATLSHWAHSQQYCYCSPPNQPSMKYFSCQSAAG